MLSFAATLLALTQSRPPKTGSGARRSAVTNFLPQTQTENAHRTPPSRNYRAEGQDTDPPLLRQAKTGLALAESKAGDDDPRGKGERMSGRRVQIFGTGLPVLAGLATFGIVIFALLRVALPDLPGRADLVIGNGTDPGSLHPHRASGIPEGRIIRALHEGLLLLDPQTLEPIPGCAHSWGVSTDGKTWTFLLQDGLRWSNGDPLNAIDFRRSWLDLIDPQRGAPYGDLLEGIIGAAEWRNGTGRRESVGIETPDPLTLMVQLTRPMPWLPFLCTQTPLQPVHLLGRDGAALGVPTNGPWQLERWDLRDRIRLTRSPSYRGPAKIQLDRIDFLAIESGNTLVNLFAHGSIDWAVGVPPGLMPFLQQDPQWNEALRTDPYLGISFYRLNFERAPFDDPAIRRALSLCLDRTALCEEVLGGNLQPAWGFVPWPKPALDAHALRGNAQLNSAFSGYSAMATTVDGAVEATSVPTDRWPLLGYDPDLARQKLIAAGWRVPGSDSGKPIPSFEILHSSGSTHALVAEWMQSSWARELGIETRIRSMEWRTFLQTQRAVDYDVSRSSWIADYPDPATFLELFTTTATNNRTSWSDAEYDRLVESARVTADAQQRMGLWQQAEKILLERGPVLPLWSTTSSNLVSPNLRGYFANPLDQHDLRALKWDRR